MMLLDKKFEQALSEKSELISKAKKELEKLSKMRASAKHYPIMWQAEVTAKNAQKTALQANILHRFFERHDTVQKSTSDLKSGMKMHQIWKKVYPQSSTTTSATFRGYVRDLQMKGLIKKGSDPDYWLLTERALEKRLEG